MMGYFDKAQMVIPTDQFGAEVWISGLKFAQDHQKVKEMGFVMVCSCMDSDYNHQPQNGLYHIHLPIPNEDSFDVKAYFEPIFEIVETSRKSGKVLIHSDLGISRCSTLVMAYLIQRYHKSAEEALDQVRAVRPCALPNPGFMDQLKWWARFCKKAL